MQPIVHRLEAEFGDRMAFVALNANTDGAAAFRQLSLLGHPSVAIFSTEGKELFRTVGVVKEEELRAEIQVALEKS